jgi:hypothetical protein
VRAVLKLGRRWEIGPHPERAEQMGSGWLDQPRAVEPAPVLSMGVTRICRCRYDQSPSSDAAWQVARASRGQDSGVPTVEHVGP